MSWTTLKGHHPVGPVEWERPIGELHARLEEVGRRCSCGASYDAAHVQACIDAQELAEAG